jgi:hypothetical protein
VDRFVHSKDVTIMVKIREREFNQAARSNDIGGPAAQKLLFHEKMKEAQSQPVRKAVGKISGRREKFSQVHISLHFADDFETTN